MENKRTYYHLILDRSGSMSSCIEQTVDGVNRQIRRIRKIAERFPDQELITSLTLFNNKISKVWTRVEPGLLREITYPDYRTEGTTALLDAVGTTVREMQKSVGPELEAGEASAVIVIITDGYENASVQFTHEQVAGLIKELESTGKWTFSYIGATLDAVEVAGALNIKRGNAMFYNISEFNLMFNKVNDSISTYIEKKESGKIDTDFLDSTGKDC